MDEYPTALLNLLGGVDEFFGNEVPCSCPQLGPTKHGRGCAFGWFNRSWKKLPPDLLGAVARNRGEARTAYSR